MSELVSSSRVHWPPSLSANNSGCISSSAEFCTPSGSCDVGESFFWKTFRNGLKIKSRNKSSSSSMTSAERSSAKSAKSSSKSAKRSSSKRIGFGRDPLLPMRIISSSSTFTIGSPPAKIGAASTIVCFFTLFIIFWRRFLAHWRKERLSSSFRFHFFESTPRDPRVSASTTQIGRISSPPFLSCLLGLLGECLPPIHLSSMSSLD
mmetsp:Transcript_1204/g.4147  ORF Transcript_1204/g.4147 Transcript_1204/m.4147 type:complete len:206 (-) Transcript_1204:143-760(-)